MWVLGRRVSWEQQLAGCWEARAGRASREQFDIGEIEEALLLKSCWLPDQQPTQRRVGQVPVAAKESRWGVLPSVLLHAGTEGSFCPHPSVSLPGAGREVLACALHCVGI